MKGTELRNIREKLGLSRDELADLFALSGYQSIMNIETEFRKPGKLITKLMRYLDGQSKANAKEFIEEFKKYSPK